MKTMRYTKFFGIILLLGILMSACVDDFDRGEREGDGKSIRLTLSIPDNVVVNPMTKATQAMSQKVDNIKVLVYNMSNELLLEKYYNTGLDNLNKEQTFTTEALSVGENASGHVFVVANAGDFKDTAYDDLEKMSFGLDGTSPLPIMCASGDKFPTVPKTGSPTYSFTGIHFDTDSSANITAELVRIYARVTVVVDTTDLVSDLTITPQTLKLYNIPMTGTLVGPNLITGSEGSKRDGEELKSTANGGNWNFLGDGEKTENPTDVLYLYENMQPEGYCKGSGDKKDQTSKTPKAFGEAITNTTQLMTDVKSSFIEVVANYDKSGTIGKIKYRFFLGKDPFTNFSVQRNVNYKITLALHNNGGVDEATWRVETESIPGKINVSDVYISYLGGSSVEMVVTGDVNGIKDGKPSLGSLNNPNTSDIGGTIDMVEMPGGTDKEKRFKFTATTTNFHDYLEKTRSVTFNMNNGSNVYTVNVHQVPRLVDPIAIYKRADNANPTEIVVKAFSIDSLTSKGRGLYHVLKSKGKWTAEIDKDCKDWVRISTINGDYEKSSIIEGEGEVRFWYKPLNTNPNSDGDGLGMGNDGNVDGGRYGKITVKYHGASCVHEIFLRQGYQPMILGDKEYAWSAFNCLGKEKNDPAVIGKTTYYPTQTGWLFNGGVDVAMHPFIPGYRKGQNDEFREIDYSDGRHPYGYGYEFSWNKPFRWNWQTVWTDSIIRPAESKQGPCPKGYVVADAQSYSEMAQNTLLYTGYVHDDDPVHGWTYDNLGNGLDISDVDHNNNCNPAKGSLYVEKGGNKNLFFNYGKGVLTGIRTSNHDNFILEEIGVGRRQTVNLPQFGYLSYTTEPDKEQGYGALYWNASPFPIEGEDHIGKVDFRYNLDSPSPTTIDIPNKEGCHGIHSPRGAHFVRCVRRCD